MVFPCWSTIMLENRTHARRLPPPAACPEDCAVGPTETELADPSAFLYWGHGKQNGTSGPTPKRRKLCGGGGGGDETEYDDVDPTFHDNGSNSSFQRTIGIFLSSGCCVIDKPVLPPHFVQTCLDRAKKDYHFLKALMEKERERLFSSSSNGDETNNNENNRHHRVAALTRQDYAEWVARDGGRVDIRYGLNKYPYNCGGLIYNSIVFPLVKALLNGVNSLDTETTNEPVQLLYVGVMWGMPVGGGIKSEDSDSGCHHQNWHADGGHLFSPDQLPQGLTLPPHCINVFYPLVDLKKHNGPTEFRIGSHRREQPASSTCEDVEFPLVCPAGSAILFDYRIQHRGRANLLEAEAPSSADNDSNNNSSSSSVMVDRARPVLYLAYAKTYFKDHGNTRSGRRLVPIGNDSVWTTRTLEGHPVPYGRGFDDCGLREDPNKGGAANERQDDDSSVQDKVTAPNSTTATAAQKGDNSEATPTAIADNKNGVGERWILFQMTLELPNGKSEALRVHKGDVAVEVAQQFCFKHGLQDDFVAVLAQTIQQQMDAV